MRLNLLQSKDQYKLFLMDLEELKKEIEFRIDFVKTEKNERVISVIKDGINCILDAKKEEKKWYIIYQTFEIFKKGGEDAPNVRKRIFYFKESNKSLWYIEIYIMMMVKTFLLGKVA